MRFFQYIAFNGGQIQSQLNAALQSMSLNMNPTRYTPFENGSRTSAPDAFRRPTRTWSRGRFALIALVALATIWVIIPSITRHDKYRPLILYSYFETPNARINAEFFIRHGLHDGADFVFILNGNTDIEDQLPEVPWVTYRKRPNTCFDLGSHAKVLLADDKKLLKGYKRFILMNASIRGPFMPTWSNQCWSEAYLDKLDHKTKMVGMTYYCKPATPEPHHVSSMLLAMDDVALNLIMDNTPIDTCFASKTDAIKVETALSGTLKYYGYNVTTLMTAFSGEKDYENTCKNDDVNWNGKYWGTSIHPYETMFQKANRDIWPEQLALLTKWTDEMKYDSQKFCGSRKTKRR